MISYFYTFIEYMGRYLGQHFLVDDTMLHGIVECIQEQITLYDIHSMREIGPGQGALTKHIFRLVTDFLCFEKDERMQKHLHAFLNPEQIIWWDVLEQSLDTSLGQWNTLLVGNLPYYITSPIFRKFFSWDSDDVVWWVFLIQKEVAEKIRTDAKKRSYLRWILNNAYTIEYMFTVPPESFDPPPKVDSAVVLFGRKQEKEFTWALYERLLAVLDILSQYKRKTLAKIWKMRADDLKAYTLPAVLWSKRLEELGWEEMKRIVSVSIS